MLGLKIDKTNKFIIVIIPLTVILLSYIFVKIIYFT